MKYICKYPRISPSIGVPVYVNDEALSRKGFPREHRGGIIIEDLSVETNGSTRYFFKVKHRNGKYNWEACDLVEIGGLSVNVDENAEDEVETMVKYLWNKKQKRRKTDEGVTKRRTKKSDRTDGQAD